MREYHFYPDALNTPVPITFCARAVDLPKGTVVFEKEPDDFWFIVVDIQGQNTWDQHEPTPSQLMWALLL